MTEAQQPGPIVTQPNTTNVGLKLNIDYAKSIPGIIRILIIVIIF